LSHVNAGPHPSALVGLIGVIALFCAPLFVGLGGLDLRSDEAIYAYAVDRMLETGEWLTPRSIQVDGPFLEKPPLKFWMVAAAIRAGILPHDEVGYRFLDALMGAIAFLYIYFLGLRIAGPVCGVVAVFMTFSMDAIVFEHGLRSHNMEAPLFLAYCSGVYHFMRWVNGRRAKLHALVVALFFVLGFLTKFVAALLLPLVCVVTIAVVPVARQRFVTRWRDWLAATILAVAVITPWFAYEWRLHGQYFWDVIFGVHVYERFTSSLDPSHLEPWHFYFSRTWTELAHAGGRLAAAVALLGLAWNGSQGRPWQLRLLLVWWIVPFALISFGTSKLFHYAYPFLPPIALGIGWAAAAFVSAADAWWGRAVAARLAPVRVSSSWLRTALLVAGALAVALAIVSAISGSVVLRVGDVRVLQNSSISRPLLIGAILFAAAGLSSISLRLMAAVVLVLALPVSDFTVRASRVTNVDQRLRAIRECAMRIGAGSPDASPGVYNAARTRTNHSHYYYLSKLGPWTEPETPDQEDVRARLLEAGQHRPVLMTLDDYEQLRRLAAEKVLAALPPAVVVDGVAVVMPGPFSVCAAAARAAGAQAPGPRD
jgi:4-amino-4-deoxy-L-arabinose transferase-like glycosyltransferase